jgi:transcriptional regulator with XRE-family HTH domain
MTGDQFAQLRFELDWTQQEVAARLGVTRFTVSRWEGQEEVPRMAELALRYLARDLRADPDGPTTDLSLVKRIAPRAARTSRTRC